MEGAARGGLQARLGNPERNQQTFCITVWSRPCTRGLEEGEAGRACAAFATHLLPFKNGKG